MKRDKEKVIIKWVFMLPFLAGHIERLSKQMANHGYMLQSVENSYNWMLRFIFHKRQPTETSFYAFISSYRPYDNTYSPDTLEPRTILDAYCTNVYANGPHLFIAQVNEIWQRKVHEYKKRRTVALLKRYIIILLFVVAVEVGIFLFAGFDLEVTAESIVVLLILILTPLYCIIAALFLFYDSGWLRSTRATK